MLSACIVLRWAQCIYDDDLDMNIAQCIGSGPQRLDLSESANKITPSPQLPKEADSLSYLKITEPLPSKATNSQVCVTFDDLIDRYCLERHLLESRVTQDHLLDVSMFLEHWKVFARAAGLTNPDIEAIRHNEYTEEDRRYKALLLWQQKKAFLATYSELIRIMLRIQKTDLAEQVCKFVNEMGENSTVAGKS